MELQKFFDSLGEKATGKASVKNVFGEPIIAEGKTIVPVARIGYGFGGGTGARNKGAANPEAGEEEGGGGGGGGGAAPVGVVEITAAGTRFIPISQHRKLLGAFASGVMFGLMLARKRKR